MLKVKKTRPNAKYPTKAHPDDVGWDVYSTSSVSIRPGEVKKVDLGIVIELPPGYYAKLRPKSGLALNNYFVNGGIIDNSFRGEIQAIVYNGNQSKNLEIAEGQKVCQMVISRQVDLDWQVEEVEELTETARNTGGFGSSGLT